MLSARAYSFRQKSRLAISLSWIGGYTNVVSFLSMGMLISHVTGTATQLSRFLGQGNFREAAFFGLLLSTFTMGAALSAFLTETARRRSWKSRYVLPMGLEALLLSALCIHLRRQGTLISGSALYVGAGLASLAMGLQNATVTKISGAVVRTTHLTGIFTDLGLEGMQYLFWWRDQLAHRGRERAIRLLKVSTRHPTTLRLLLLLSIAGSFGFGAVAGTVAYAFLEALSLVAPVGFLLWIVYVDCRTPIADIRELDLENDPELALQGILSKLLPPEVVLYRSSCVRAGIPHRAPDFQGWMDRVPEHCRVVVLAISSLTHFDANAVLDLEAAIARLHAQKRKLVLSGVTSYQFRHLQELGVTRMMDVNNLCPDLEFAIARAMAVLEDLKSEAQGGAPDHGAADAGGRSIFRSSRRSQRR